MKKNNNKYIITLFFFLLVFFIILKDIFQYEITTYDNWAYNIFVKDLRSNNMTTFMKIITSFGGGIFLISILIVLFVTIKDKMIGLFASANLVVIYLLNNLVKVIVQRPRPSGYNLINESFYSFPSGHSMISTAFYGFIIYLVYKKINNRVLKYSIIFLLFNLIILICVSRIYLGVHYLSDTLAGFALSMVYLMSLVYIIPYLKGKINYEGKGRKKEKKKS